MSKQNIFLEMAGLKDLTTSERFIIDYILENPSKIGNMTIVELGAQTYTSASTVSRVCQKLNTNGFTDFRQRINSDLSNYQEYVYLNKNKIPLDISDSLDETLDKIIVNTTRAISDVKILNSIDNFQQAIEWLQSSQKITLYGSGISNLICHDAMVKGLRMGLNINTYNYYSEQSMAARLSAPEDLAIIVSYTGLTTEMLKISRILHMNKTKSISITSNSSNEIAKNSMLNFYVGNTESYYRIGGVESRMSMQCVLDIIFSGYYYQTQQARETSKMTFIDDTFSVKWEEKESK